MLTRSRALVELNGRRDPLGRWITNRWTGHDGQVRDFPSNPEPLNAFPSCFRRAGQLNCYVASTLTTGPLIYAIVLARTDRIASIAATDRQCIAFGQS